jgi:hypothetical protein
MAIEGNRYQVTNTFSGGMNSDADKSILAKNQYLYSENFRLFGDGLNSVGSLECVTGNAILSTISSVIPDGYWVVGHCNIRDELYLFITQNTALGQTGYSKILKIIFTADGNGISTASVVYDDQLSSDSSRLLWNRLPQYRVKAVGRYESETIKKIYFADGLNPVRSINVATVSTTSPVNKFDLIPNFNISNPQFVSFGSGKLTAGKIQYAYQMYDLNGPETLFSPTSSLISISETSGQSGSNKTFKGSDLDENTGKGIRLSIFPPSGFSRIRVVSIKYNSLNAIPIVSIIADQDISTTPSTTYFYDTGISNLGSYTYEEIAIVGRNVFSAAEIEEKNNYLFAANVVDNDWDIDFDARTYRFVKSTATGTLTSGHSAIFDTGSWGSNNWYNINSNFKINGSIDVPEKADCLNPYNDITLDSQIRTDTSPTYVHLYNLKYQVDGTTLGGSGVNVSYKFIQKEFIISDTGTVYNEDYCYNTDYSNANIEVTYLGYQRDEIYRFGIVFFDNKGRQSSVKWIGDIRFPFYGDSYTLGYGDVGPTNYFHSFYYNGKTYGRAAGITFTINTTSVLSQGATKYKIVRVDRKLISDRNILAQGLTPTMFRYNDGTGYAYKGYTIPYTGTSTPVVTITKEPTMLEFLSPEINFNKTLSYTTSDTLEFIGTTNIPHQWSNITNANITIGTLPSDTNYSFTLKYEGMGDVLSLGDPLTTDFKYYRITPITSSLIFGVPSKSINTFYTDGINMDGVAYKVSNFTESAVYPLGGAGNQGDAAHFSPGGTKLIIKTTSSIANFNTNTWVGFYCNYKRGVFNSQYGGNSYSSRQSNYYIDCNGVNTCISGSVTSNVYGGDTYIGMFDYLRNIVTGDIPSNRRSQLVMYFPVETSINLRYREDECFSKTNDTTNHDRILMQELAGIYVSGAMSYTQKIDLYKYNSVYSQENTTKKSYPKSDVLPSGNIFHDNRVMVSDLKIDGELSDNWTIFKMDNFLDVDSKHGQITTLMHKDNYLYFWQPRAFGVLSVSQRSLIQDNNQGQLVIGTGGVLDRYDYLSTNEGCSKRFSVVEGLKGIYWFDNNNHTIYKYSGQGIEPISKVKGVQEFIRRSIGSNVESISCYSKANNEVMISLPNASSTFVYSEIFDSFVGVQTFLPFYMLKANGSKNPITINRGTRDNVYMHNIGGRGWFYGVLRQSMIRFMVNDQYSSTKVYDMIQYESTSDSSGTNITFDTFNYIKVVDDYQDSNQQSIITSGSSANITRKEREFCLNIPRNRTGGDETRLFKERMRDKYLTIDLTYNNTNGYIFSVPYVTTNYRISKR